MSTKERYAHPWKNISKRWKIYTPPGRPSKKACSIFKEYAKKAIKHKKNPKALVIGATPELRDVLYELKCEVTFVDINMEMILAMTELRKHKDDAEIMVRGSWLNTPLKSEYYDVVLGDLVLPNVPLKMQKTFLREIQRLLKRGGYFITKHNVIPNDVQSVDMEHILKLYEKVPEHKNYPMELFCYMLCFCNGVWDQKTKILDCSIIKKKLKRYLRGKKYTYPNKKIEKALNEAWHMWQPLDKVWTVYNKKDTEKLCGKYFDLRNEFILNDCKIDIVDQAYPMWISKVKK